MSGLEGLPVNEDKNSKLPIEDIYVWKNKDFYERLSIPVSASMEEIKQSFRTLSQKYHPDAISNDTASKSNFEEVQKLISEAYTTLRNPAKRIEYNNRLGYITQNQEQFYNIPERFRNDVLAAISSNHEMTFPKIKEIIKKYEILKISKQEIIDDLERIIIPAFADRQLYWTGSIEMNHSISSLLDIVVDYISLGISKERILNVTTPDILRYFKYYVISSKDEITSQEVEKIKEQRSKLIDFGVSRIELQNIIEERCIHRFWLSSLNQTIASAYEKAEDSHIPEQLERFVSLGISREKLIVRIQKDMLDSLENFINDNILTSFWSGKKILYKPRIPIIYKRLREYEMLGFNPKLLRELKLKFNID